MKVTTAGESEESEEEREGTIERSPVESVWGGSTASPRSRGSAVVVARRWDSVQLESEFGQTIMISESDIEEPTPKPAHPISPIEVSTSQLTSTDVSFESTVKV